MRAKFRKSLSKDEIARVNEFRLNPPQSIRKLAEDVGVGVVELDLPLNEIAFLDERPDLGYKSGYVIFINKNINNFEKRWALAHELGHYFLHRDKRSGTFDAKVHLQLGWSNYWLLEDEEHEAESFAEDIFFGGGALQAFVDLHGSSASILAGKVFGVPTEKVVKAIKFHREYLGLRDGPQRLSSRPKKG